MALDHERAAFLDLPAVLLFPMRLLHKDHTTSLCRIPKFVNNSVTAVLQMFSMASDFG